MISQNPGLRKLQRRAGRSIDSHFYILNRRAGLTVLMYKRGSIGTWTPDLELHEVRSVNIVRR